jgi:hypothetical protein
LANLFLVLLNWAKIRPILQVDFTAMLAVVARIKVHKKPAIWVFIAKSLK